MIIVLPIVDKTKDILKICIYSIIDYNKDKEIEFYIMYLKDQVSKETLEEISQIANNITFIDFTNWVDIFHKASKLYGNYTTYLRLLMPRFLQIYRPEVDRFIYCDEDYYCTGDINKFYNLDFEGKEFIGILEPTFNEYVMLQKNSYIFANAGLLLINTKFDLSGDKSLFILDHMSFRNVLHIRDCNDQTFINIYGMKIICDRSLKRIYNVFKNAEEFLPMEIDIIKFSLEQFNITHLHSHLKGDEGEEKMLKNGLINQKCERKNKVNKSITPHMKQYMKVDPTDEVICKVREYIHDSNPYSIQSIYMHI